jgi:hypothetical protein
MKMVSADDELDLKDVEIDPSLFVKPCDISIVPVTVDKTEMLGVSGAATYPWGDVLTKREFKWYTNVNEVLGANMWLKEITDDDWHDEAEELSELFNEMGFPSFIFEGVGDDEEDDDDDA